MSNDLKEIAEFVHWFEEKARAEFPNLEIITALYTENGWPQCEEGLVKSLADRFPNASEDHFGDIQNGSGSGATTRHPFRSITGAGKTAMVMKINMDQCAAMADGNMLEGVKACICHEMGHILGSAHRGNTLGSLLEENGADIFEVLAMTALGHEDHPESLLHRRVMSLDKPDKLDISRRYGFPTVYEEAQDLIESYKDVDLDSTSFAQLLDDAEDFIEARRDKFDQWFGFDDAMYKLSGETTDDADLLGAAAHAGNPLVDIISRVSGIEPNMDFKPMHEPNPFLSRACAHQYPREVPTHRPKQDQKTPYQEVRGLVPEGFVIMHPNGYTEGTYDIEQEQLTDEPPFS